MAGAFGLYEREKEAERIHIPGPIKEDIVIYVSALYDIDQTRSGFLRICIKIHGSVYLGHHVPNNNE